MTCQGCSLSLDARARFCPVCGEVVEAPPLPVRMVFGLAHSLGLVVLLLGWLVSVAAIVFCRYPGASELWVLSFFICVAGGVLGDVTLGHSPARRTRWRLSYLGPAGLAVVALSLYLAVLPDRFVEQGHLMARATQLRQLLVRALASEPRGTLPEPRPAAAPPPLQPVVAPSGPRQWEAPSVQVVVPREAVSVSVDWTGLQNETLFPCAAHMLQGLKASFAKVTVRNAGNVPLHAIRVALELEQFSDAAVETIDLAVGQERTVGVSLLLSGDRLASVAEERPGAVRFGVITPDGRVLQEGRTEITIASRNDMPFMPEADLQFALTVAFVTPNTPVIDEILAEARHYTSDGAIKGYQRSNVREEVKAIYTVLAELGIGYRSATNTFLSRRGLSGQKVYFPEETVRLTAGNCVDGSVLLASALEKAGFQPVLVFVPGHAFVGVRSAPTTSECVFVETTCIGSASFEQAEQVASERFRMELAAERVTVLDVADLRRRGLLPFPYAVTSGRSTLRARLSQSRRFDLRLLEIAVSPKDYPLGRRDPGGAPELFVVVGRSRQAFYTSRDTFAQDAWRASFAGRNAGFEVELRRGDSLQVDIYDRNLVGETHIMSGVLSWADLVGRAQSLVLTENGSQVSWQIAYR